MPNVNSVLLDLIANLGDIAEDIHDNLPEESRAHGTRVSISRFQQKLREAKTCIENTTTESAA